ncbi:MAG: CCA tRNA nucleotidyltransferase [Pyrinomonadaceae bacterium]
MEMQRDIKSLVEAVDQRGGRAMLVGGCVRDELRGVEAKDFDIEVFGIAAVELRAILEQLGNVNVVGEAFTVYKLGGNLDVSLPRKDRKTERGHKGFVVEGDPEMSFEDAARRRDFTINAIMKDAKTGEIIDPFGGRADLRARVLRAVDRATFPEDPLRALRAAQFAARFEFAISPETIELCKAVDVSELAAERIWGELEKILLKAEKPSIGLRWLYDLEIVARIFPELAALKGVPQEPEWHPEGDVDVHTLLVVDEARKLIDDLAFAKRVSVMLGALCHDFGKPATTKFLDDRWRSLGHEEAGVAPTESFLNRLNLYTLRGFDVRKQVVELVRHHLKPGMFYNVRGEIGDGAFRRLARKVEPDLLYRVAKADSLGRNAPWVPKENWFDAEPMEWFIKRCRELDVENNPPTPLLGGRHLIEFGLKPSPEFGRILNSVYELQLDGTVTTLVDAKREAMKLIEFQ